MKHTWLVGVASVVLWWGCAEGSTPPDESTNSSGGGGAGGSVGSGGVGGVVEGGGGSGGDPIGPCNEDPCKLTAPQCGCPSDQKCSINSGGETLCVADGTVPLYGDCSGGLACQAGSICTTVKQGPPAVSVCREFCDNDLNCDAPGGLCVLSLPGATACSENCDPDTNTGCAVPGTGCQAVQEQGGDARYYTYCSGSGNGGQGAICTNATDCQPGFGCFDLDGSLECTEWCIVGDNGTCAVGTCQNFVPPITLEGGPTYGFCQ